VVIAFTLVLPKLAANASTYFDFRTSTGTAISNNGDGTICSTPGMSCKYVVINLGQPSAAIVGPKYYQLNTTNFNILGGGCTSGALDIAVYDDPGYTKLDFQFPLAGSGTSPLPASTNVNFSVPADKFAQLIFGCNDNGFQGSTINGGPGSYQIRDVNALLYSGLPNLCIGDTPVDCGATSMPTIPSEPSLVQVTNFPGETAKHPNWSPKGDFISYISNRASGNGRMNDVWAVAPDGSNAHQLTAMPDDGFEGGTFEASWIGSTGDLVLVDVNIIYEWLRLQLSTNPPLPVARTPFDGPSPNYQELLTIPGGLGGLSFALSQDGQNAAWSTMTSFSCPWTTNAVVAPFSVLNGQATTSVGSFVTLGSFGCNQIPKSEAIVGISFSLDASELVLARAPDPNVVGYDLEIYTASGQFVRKLTNNGIGSTPVINWNPSWSSDGRIAFASNQTGRFEIYTINPDGSNLTSVTANGGDWPTWSPDSSKIAFQSTRSGNSEIYSLLASQNAPSTGTILATTNLVAATFTISGSVDFSGGGISTTLQNVPIGTYIVTFGSASGYITPPQQTQTLLAGGTLRLSANYVPILLQVSPSNVFFNYQAETMIAPPSQSISVTTSANTSVPMMISVNTTPAGGTWFSITSSSGATPSMLTVSVMTGLDPGTYSGTVTVTSTGVLNGPQAIPVTLQVTTPGGPFSSTATWRKLNGSWNSDCDGSFGAIAVASGNRDTVYIGSSRSSEPCGLYKSANSGKTWTAINTGFPQFGIFPFQQYPSVSKIAIASSDHSVVYVGTIFGDGTSGRILRSDNAGRVWTDASGQSTLGIFAPTINAPVLDISISPVNASIVFSGLSKAGIFKTQNSGKDWMLVRGGTLVPGETDNFYVVRFAQSNLSMAYGAGFTAFSGSLFPCVISEGGEGDCVDFKGDVPFSPFILTDENGGTLFSSLLYPTTILGNGPLITDLAIDPSDSNTVYASTIAYAALSIEIIPAPVPNLGVFKTQDGGLHWKPVNGSSDLDVSQFPLFRLVMDPIDPHTLYAVAGASGIFVTTNGGENWKRVLMNGLPTGTFIGNLALGDSRRLYALTSSGVYVLGN